MFDAVGLQRTIDRLNACGTLADMNGVLSETSRFLGFDYFACAVFPTRISGDIMGVDYQFATDYPISWHRRYRAQHYAAIDPVVTVGRVARLPFRWGSDSGLRQLASQSRKFMLEARDFGVVSGVAVPVHGPRGDWGLFGMSIRGDIVALEKVAAGSVFQLQALAPVVQEIALAHYHAQSQRPQIKLTDRERTCLDWTIRGKTAWEIAQIIGRSKPTVDYHLQKAIHKLDAANKYHAALKALYDGLL